MSGFNRHCENCGVDTTLTGMYMGEYWGTPILLEAKKTCHNCGQVELFCYGESEILKEGKMVAKAGDFIIYSRGEGHNEIGLVKRVAEDGSVYAFYHLGGTASRTPKWAYRLITENEIEMFKGKIDNYRIFNSLKERQRRMIYGGDYEDLIDLDWDGNLV